MHGLSRYRPPSLRRQRGFTMVELMVAMVISLILMAGIGQIYLSAKKSYSIQNSLAHQQQTARYVMEVISQDLRRAGYWGGNAAPAEITGSLGIATDNGTCPSGDDSWGRMLDRRLFGLNDSNNSGATSNYSSCIPNTDYIRGDILVVRYTAPWIIGSTTTPAFENNRVYLRTGLFDGHVFKGANAADPENQINTAATPIGRDSELVAHAYYISTSPGQPSCTGVTVPSLFRESLDDNGRPAAEEVAYGVDNLQVRYGIDDDISAADFDGDGSVDQYFDAQNVPDWSQVITARIWLLTRAECPETGYTNTNTYAMADQNYAVNDGFRRQLYQTTVNVRNR